MPITYPPEMLPNEPGADVIVCARDGCPKDAEIERLEAENKNLRAYAKHERSLGAEPVEAELLCAVQENALLRRLVQALLDNNPADDAADGVTVLDVWRKEAKEKIKW